MLRTLSFIALGIAILATHPPEALAWGKSGHRVTGQIAQAYLSDEARDAINSLIGPEDLAEASTWPDFMRASEEEFWAHEAGPYHYVTVPQGETYSDSGAPPQGDAISALQRFTETLQDDTATREDRALALRFIVHIIGDLHQPLHAGNGTDLGGNQFGVTFFGETTNLHSVWDSGMIDHEQLSFSEMSDWLLRRVTSDQLQEWSNVDPEIWVTESTVIRDTIYPEERDLAWGYVFDWKATYQTRLTQAGFRMALYLNDVFDAPAPETEE